MSFAGQRGERHLVVLHASGGMQKNPVPGREFDLGLGTGLRAFPAHAFTGDRYFVLSSEYRYLVLATPVRASSALAWRRSPDMPARGRTERPARTGTELGLGSGWRRSARRAASGGSTSRAGPATASPAASYSR